jgi:hypothetical protein
LAALFLVLFATAVAGQTPVRLTQEARFTKGPAALVLGTLLPGAEVTPGRTQGSAVEVQIEGWVPSASLTARKRENFDVSLTKRPNEELRAAPDGAVTGRVSPNVGFITVETRGSWTRVRRAVWIDQQAIQPTAPISAAASGPDRAEVRFKVPLAVVAAGAAIGSVDSGAGVRILTRSGGWTRVQVEAWIPDSALRSTDNRILVGLSQAEVRANPARYIGQMVEWRLQFVAIQRADELRPEIPQGMPYLLTRGPLPEPGFVYVVVPSAMVRQFEAVTALKELTVRGTIRSASTKYLPTPVLDLVEVVGGLGD